MYIGDQKIVPLGGRNYLWLGPLPYLTWISRDTLKVIPPHLRKALRKILILVSSLD